MQSAIRKYKQLMTHKRTNYAPIVTPNFMKHYENAPCVFRLLQVAHVIRLDCSCDCCVTDATVVLTHTCDEDHPHVVKYRPPATPIPLNLPGSMVGFVDCVVTLPALPQIMTESHMEKSHMTESYMKGSRKNLN